MREAPNLPPTTPLSVAPSKRGGRVTDRILPPEARGARESFLRRTLFPYLERITDAGTALGRFFNEDDIRARLLRAGFPYNLKASTFRAIKLLSVIIGTLLALLYFPILANLFSIQLPPAMLAIVLPLWAAMGAFYGFRLPDVWLGIQISKRKKEIQLILPDMIDLISISVEAGLGLMMAIQRISERFPNALSEEFQRTLQEVRLGVDQPNALRDMARRVDLDDLTTLLTAIVQAELLGLAVSNVLRVQSERLRERRSQRAREAAQKAPIKMTFPLVLFIFPALFLIILGPAMLKIFFQQSAF